MSLCPYSLYDRIGHMSITNVLTGSFYVTLSVLVLMLTIILRSNIDQDSQKHTFASSLAIIFSANQGE